MFVVGIMWSTCDVCRNKPKSELTEEEMRKKEEEEFQTGPLSVLTQSVKHNTQVTCVCVYVCV